MKVSLRKANAIQAAINEALNGLDLSVDLALDEFSRLPEAKLDAKLRFENNMNERTSLITALYEIRNAVAAANASAGINEQLAKVARLEKDIQLFTRLAKQEVEVADDILRGKQAKIANRKEEVYYGRDDVIRTTFLSQENIDSFVASLKAAKKDKVAAQDALLELNVRTEIELSENTVATLKRVGTI